MGESPIRESEEQGGAASSLVVAYNALHKYHIPLSRLVACVLAFLIFFRWPSYYTLIALGITLSAILWFHLRDSTPETRHSVEGLAAFLSCLALLLAGYWYFVERRGIPKLNAVPTIQTWPIGDGKAFVRVEVLLQNVGNTDIDLQPEDDFRLEIGQVLPAYGSEFEKLDGEFRIPVAGEEPLRVLQSDKYPLRARVAGGLDLKIEAGETERKYFKAIIPCFDGLVAAARIDVPKKLDRLQRFFEEDPRQHYWRGQALAEPIQNCEGE